MIYEHAVTTIVYQMEKKEDNILVSLSPVNVRKITINRIRYQTKIHNI